MKTVALIFQVLVSLGLLNVWLLRFRQPTPYRGGQARSMPEEFAAYGLPRWFLWVVGGMKLACAFSLLLGIWMPVLVAPAAVIITVLMVGAIAMHFKVHDPVMKAVPASTVLALIAVVLVHAL